MLVFFTDGVVDMENEAGEAFGVERLEGLLLREGRSGGDDLLSHLAAALRSWRGGKEPADDATLVVLRRPEGLDEAAPPRLLP